MTPAEAILKKLDAVTSALDALPKRSMPRPPQSLLWVAMAAGWGKWQNKMPDAPCPKSCASLRGGFGARPSGDFAKEPADRLARTFCALEDFEQWLARAAAGAEKHQGELERQAQTKLVRLRTYAEMS